MRLIQGLFEGFRCLGLPQSLEIGDRLDCGSARLIGAHEWQWLVRSVQWLANGLLIVEVYHSKKDRKSVEGLRVDNAKRPGARTDT